MVYLPEEQALFITGSGDKTLKNWNVKTASEVKTLDGHTNFIACMVYVPEEQALVTGSEDTVKKKKWNVKTASEVKTLCKPTVYAAGEHHALECGRALCNFVHWWVMRHSGCSICRGAMSHVFQFSPHLSGRCIDISWRQNKHM